MAPPNPLIPPDGPSLQVVDLPGDVGCRYRWEFRRLGLPGHMEGVLTERIPGERLVFQSTRGWRMKVEVTLRPEQGGTLLLCHLQYHFPPPWRWMVPGPLIRLGAWKALQRIKEIAESPGSPDVLSS